MTDPVNAQEGLFGAERAKAFIDAVVAIAMTLLILPLMESVAEASAKGDNAGAWVAGHTDQLFAFVLSFAIIAMFWINHHRVFTLVERVSTALLWITMGWLLSIVWLPVVTAMVGQMPSTDRLLIAMYIGSMILTTLLGLATILYLRAHPSMHDISRDRVLRWMAVDLAMIVLFALSLLIAVIVPVVSYFALFLMLLTRPVQGLFARALGVKRVTAQSAEDDRRPTDG